MKNIRLHYLAVLTMALLAAPIAQAQKVLFDATKAQTAGNADWLPDADVFNLCYNPNASVGCGNEANANGIPTPAQSGITSNTGESYWKGALSAYAVDIVKKGYIVESLPYNGQITFNNGNNPKDLSNYDVFVVCEPNILFTSSEKTAIINWVAAGGGLLMVGDHNSSDRNNDGQDSPHIWNDLSANNSVQTNPFGITFDYANFSQTTTNVRTATNPIIHGPQGTVSKMQYSAGTSMTLNPSANSTVKGVVYKTGSSQGNQNVMAAYSSYGSGRVVAIGDSSPVDDGSGDTNDALYNGYTGQVSGNHKKLLLNSFLWLAGVTNLQDPPKGSGEKGLVLSPNPATDWVNLQMPEGEFLTNLVVTDLQGRNLLIQSFDANEQVPSYSMDTANLPNGIYMVKYATADAVGSLKLVVNH
ncbi:MAG: T9SS type A sorting domain-containing protein [Saprospiraceae bacterium]|nr:T9SS type A sorting domain-containing protein [Saprospiraceae bacterium]